MTAELAVVLPALTVLLAVLLLGVSAGMLQLRLEEGARAGARALARGDSLVQVQDTVARVSGSDASVSLALSVGYATVTVRGRVGGALSGLVPWTQTAQASARVESAGHNMRSDGSTARKSSLWRWVRTPECRLRTGLCEATAAGTLGGVLVQG
ncbi:TadE family type IV pilus minor pilin [Arthrobacter sp. LAPM80]|uniref:TadE family type IV pilus minor pilin n=1 Tax=Arthrobacter sp. LAPM80 TaxID=3141788 RepID=UPI00398ADBBD